MNELLDEVTEIPFSIFWMKYLEKGGMCFWQTRANAVWWQLNEKERAKAFNDVCQGGTTDPAFEYLKQYHESIR
jgi:hypothetical protein